MWPAERGQRRVDREGGIMGDNRWQSPKEGGRRVGFVSHPCATPVTIMYLYQRAQEQRREGDMKEGSERGAWQRRGGGATDGRSRGQSGFG